MEKKQASGWKIAASYWFSAFAIGSFVDTVLIAIVAAFSFNVPNYALFINIVNAVIGLLAIWVGAIYAGWMTNKKYIVQNRQEVVVKAFVIYTIVVMFFALIREPLIMYFAPILQTPGFTGIWGGLEAFGIGTIESGFITLVYIFSALKYIKNSDQK